MKLKFLTLALLSAFGLSACDHRYAESHSNTSSLYLTYNNYTDNLLARETYRAADRMMNQSRKVARNTPVLVGTINDIDRLETASTFGRVIQEQVSTRLTQRGYNVTELKLRNSLNIKQGLINPSESGEFMLSRDLEALKGEHKTAAVITGTYTAAGEEVMVNLKLLDVATGRILGSTDYSVTLDSNTRKLIKNNPHFTFYGQSQAYN